MPSNFLPVVRMPQARRAYPHAPVCCNIRRWLHDATPPTTLADPRFQFLQDLAAELSQGKISFPTFADATLKVRMALNDPRMNADRIARLLSTEPLLATRLLRLANSAAYSTAGAPSTDVRSAVIRVGFGTIRALAVNVALEQLTQMKDLAPVAGLAREILSHSVDVAALASIIARNMTPINPDEALFAGLVHDIGRFYMLSRVARYPGLEPGTAEFTGLLDQWHAAVGHAVLSSLDVPEEIAEAVNRHEDEYLKPDPQDLADVLNAANRASHGPNPLNDLTAEELPVTLDAPRVTAVLASSADALRRLAASLHG
jgi:putative nucleotidyltransferase with HDIG domain